LDVLLEGVLVLLLLVQHVLLLGLLQGPLINVPPVHLLQLLALLQGKQGTQMGRSRARPMQGRQQRYLRSTTCAQELLKAILLHLETICQENCFSSSVH